MRKATKKALYEFIVGVIGGIVLLIPIYIIVLGEL